MTKEPGISPMQGEALRLLLSFKVITYEDLVKIAFKKKGMAVPKYIPAISVLTYKEAKILIDHGNKVCDSLV